MADDKTRLYVAKLHPDADSQALKDLFSNHGTVKEARVIKDRETHKSRGFGFVQMNNPVEAERALALNGEKFMGKVLNVTYAREKENK